VNVDTATLWGTLNTQPEEFSWDELVDKHEESYDENDNDAGCCQIEHYWILRVLFYIENTKDKLLEVYTNLEMNRTIYTGIEKIFAAYHNT
jgi:acetone carboxylase gamma subunit